MVLRLKKPVDPKKIGAYLAQAGAKPKRKTLRAHFGKLRRKLNGLSYQKKVRSDWP